MTSSAISPAQVKLYFDFISPYAYLGWVELRRMERQLAVSIDPVPVLFAGLLNAHGTLGPAEVVAKRKFVFLDSLRKAALLEIPISPPFGHPFNPLLPLRVSLAAEPEHRPILIDHLFAATWEHGINVSSSDALRRHLDKIEDLGLDLDALWHAAESPEVKASLRTSTDEAIAHGVFGVPSFRFRDELYWGVDNIPSLLAAIEGRTLVFPEERELWTGLEPLAQRKVPGAS